MLRYLFCDMNSYFASVEQQERPHLRGRPIAVIPMMAQTTCCIAASYEAKACGVKTGTPVHEASKLCPAIRFVVARPDLYVRYRQRDPVKQHVVNNRTPLQVLNDLPGVALWS